MARTPGMPLRRSPSPRSSTEAATGILIRSAQATDDPAVRQRLRNSAVTLNLPLARALALRFGAGPLDRDDVIQVAHVALVHAVDRFDPERGCAFTAYATATIRGEIQRHFRDATWLVRPPRGAQEGRLRLVERGATLTQELGREPSRAELATALGLSVADIRSAELAHANRLPTSLDQPVGDGSSRIADRIPDPENPLDDIEWSIALRQALALLGRRDRMLLELRFVQVLSQQAIAHRLGVSQMHVSRRLRAILTQLRLSLGVEITAAAG